MIEIALTHGKVAVIDDEDLPLVVGLHWQAKPGAGGKWYARHVSRTSEGFWSVYMHRLILDAEQVDHVNGDGLDNRRQNLRLATAHQNNRNRAPGGSLGYKGVTLTKATGRYRAVIRVEGQLKHLGYFTTPEQAALAYNSAARAFFGEFARLNVVRAAALPKGVAIAPK